MAGRLRAGSVTAAVAVSLALAAAGAGAQDSDVAPEKLVCTFPNGTSVSYEAGGFQSKPASPLAFTVTTIDLDGQSAELVTSEGSPPVTLRIIRAVNANHFLEVVNEGFLNLTTIYDKDPKTGRHPAVHSRHLGLVGQPVFGQYTGTCSE
jgi:hypothetical protein